MKTGFENVASGTPHFGSLNIFYNAGGKIESEGTRGLSHLAEHLLCKSYDHLSELLDAHGIDYNAITGENKVYFYFNGLNEHLKKFELELLKILSYIPSKEDFEKEKKIVLSEYAETMSQPRVLFLNVIRKYFNSFTAIGFKKDIEEITYEQYLEFQLKNFSNPTYILRVGDTNLESYYKNLTYSEYTEKEYIQKDYGDSFLECDRGTRRALIGHWHYSDLNVYELEFIENYLSFGLQSPLYQELREKLGLVYSVSFSSLILGKKSMSWLSYESDPKYKVQLRNAIKFLMKDLPKNLSKTRYENIVEMMKTSVIKTNIFNFKCGYSTYQFENSDYETFFNNYSYEKFEEDIKRFTTQFLKESKIAELTKGMKL